MDKVSRRAFLCKSGQAAVGLGACAMVGGGARSASGAGSGAGAKAGSLKVPMEIEYRPAWLTWVASTTGCLRALGIDCDHADVAGYSGYAFLTNVAEGLHPSGPTAFDWGRASRMPN